MTMLDANGVIRQAVYALAAMALVYWATAQGTPHKVEAAPQADASQVAAVGGPVLFCEADNTPVIAGDVAVVDVLTLDIPSLRAYETTLQIVRIAGSGTASLVCPGAVAVNTSRPDFVFAGFTPGLQYFTAVNCLAGRATASLVTGGVAVGASPVYLADYTFHISADASTGSMFEVSIVPGQSFLVSPSGASIPYTTGPSCTLVVGCQSGSPCNDGNACTTMDTCIAGQCMGGPPLACADSNICTDDACNPDSGCTFLPNVSSCDDGLFCTAVDTCSNGACTGIGNPCGALTCDESNDTCESSPASPPAAPSGAQAVHNRLKNRYISFMPNNGVLPVAFRVQKAALAANEGFCAGSPGAACTGAPAQGTCPAGSICMAPFIGGSPAHSCWVQIPVQTGNDIHTAKCDPTPVFRVWTEPVVHVGDCEIIPTSHYHVFTSVTPVNELPTPLNIQTSEMPTFNVKVWGDNVGTNNGVEWTPPNRFTNVQDVLSILAIINGSTIRPHFTVANLQAVSAPDSCLNPFVNVADVLIGTQAVSGANYGAPATGKITNTAACPTCP